MEILEEIDILGRDIIRWIRSEWPVDTGDSKAGFYFRIVDNKIAINNTEDYWRYVRYAGQTEPAIDVIMRKLEPRIQARVRNISKEAIRRLTNV